jgi:hypothetical protein
MDPNVRNKRVGISNALIVIGEFITLLGAGTTIFILWAMANMGRPSSVAVFPFVFAIIALLGIALIVISSVNLAKSTSK